MDGEIWKLKSNFSTKRGWRNKGNNQSFESNVFI